MTPGINYNNFAGQLLPSGQRKPKWLLFIRALLYPIMRLYSRFMAYRKGDNVSAYNSILVYVKDARVRFGVETWQSVQDMNTGNTPGENSEWWVLYNPNFVGATERALFDGTYLRLTRALNREFGTTFRQPPYPAPYDYGSGTGTFSDIYITNLAPIYKSFAFGTASQPLGVIAKISLTVGIAKASIIGAASSYVFSVHVPLTVFNAQGVSDPIREQVIRNVIDKYKIAGTTYTIQTY